jgi:hypothetical protein
MFQITFYVDDKNLGEAFKRLTGIGKNVSHVYMPNIEGRANGKVHVSGTDAIDLFAKLARKHKYTELDATKARKIVTEMGFSETSYSYMLQSLVKAGLMTKRKPIKGNAMIYTLKPEK